MFRVHFFNLGILYNTDPVTSIKKKSFIRWVTVADGALFLVIKLFSNKSKDNIFKWRIISL